MPEISIIVPVYKVEKYIYRCIDSILAQTFTNFECILIDDGSPENCPVICDEYASKDSRILVIHQKNTGVSAARNAGLNMARGEWIGFVDSDDWIEPDALELLYKKQQETDADIVLGGFNNVYSWGKIKYNYPEIPYGILPIEYFLINDIKCIWGNLYRKLLFNDYIVPQISIGEDVIINTQIYIKIKLDKLKIINDIVYNYDRNSNGITNQKKYCYKSYTEDPFIKCRLWVENYLLSMELNESVNDACLYYIINGGITRYLKHSRNIEIKKEIDFFYKNYHQRFVKSKYYRKMRIFNRILIPLYHFSFVIGISYSYIFSFFTYIIKYFQTFKYK